MTTYSDTPMIDTTVWSSETLNKFARVVRDDGILLEEGEFLVRFPNTGYTCIGKFTGRTRKFFETRTKWGLECPTFDRFEIDTVVRDSVVLADGTIVTNAIWGVRGAKIPGGTWAMRPDRLVTRRMPPRVVADAPVVAAPFRSALR